MADLNERERFVLQVVRGKCRGGRPIETAEVIFAADQHMGYDSMCKALASLVSKGLLSKPRRGYYLPTEEKS